MNIKLHKIVVVFLISVTSVFSQNTTKIDTSYSVYSSFIKYKKYFPEIEIVKRQSFENVSEEKEITYKEIGDRKLHIDAFYNKNKQLKPAVILIHGGGWKSGNKSHLEPLAQSIASKGYACFTVEYRLSLEAKYPEGIFDIKQAIQFVRENADAYFVDSSKIAVLGCSSGGQMAALVGTTNYSSFFEECSDKSKYSSAVQAIIDLDGVLAFKHPDSSEGDMAAFWLGGNSKDKLETWLNASALSHTNKNTPPILFIGSQYPRFLAGRDDMIKILDENGIYNQVENIKNSPHPFWLFHPYFEEIEIYITNFLDKTLKTN